MLSLYRANVKKCFGRIDAEHLLLGRKAMTNLESILKSRDITLLTKVHRAKAMVFSGVKAGPYRRLSAEELMLLNCGA